MKLQTSHFCVQGYIEAISDRFKCRIWFLWSFFGVFLV